MLRASKRGRSDHPAAMGSPHRTALSARPSVHRLALPGDAQLLCRALAAAVDHVAAAVRCRTAFDALIAAGHGRAALRNAGAVDAGFARRARRTIDAVAAGVTGGAAFDLLLV